MSAESFAGSSTLTPKHARPGHLRLPVKQRDLPGGGAVTRRSPELYAQVMDQMADRTLILVRHAKSSWDFDVDDHQRPLSGRGRRDAKAVGRLLTDLSLRPDRVLCSTAARTRETWNGAMAGGASAGEVRFDRAIYHAWVPELVSLVRQTPESIATLMMIGHAPGIPDLVDHLCVRTISAEWVKLDHKFPTSGLVVIKVPGPWTEIGKGRAALSRFEVPRG